MKSLQSRQSVFVYLYISRKEGRRERGKYSLILVLNKSRPFTQSLFNSLEIPGVMMVLRELKENVLNPKDEIESVNHSYQGRNQAKSSKTKKRHEAGLD